METLGLPSLNLLRLSHSPTLVRNTPTNGHLSVKEVAMATPLKLSSTFKTSRNSSSVEIRAANEDLELKQMRDMAAAKKRWDVMIREGKVKVLTPREAGYAIQLSNKTLLDVRPSVEHEKAWVKGSTWIPMFEVDSSVDIGAISKKITSFVMGIIGLLPSSSLAACELLQRAGYTNLFWVQGGLEAAEEEDLVREGPVPLKFAGIGGVSEFLGWTDQQRAAAAREGWGYRLLFSARLIGLFLAADALYIGVQQVGHYIQEMKSH
ncbi:Rhodanese-like domain-containing protein 11, chloroplastic [Linum grandiflorum]